jgi:hypothetical protein
LPHLPPAAPAQAINVGFYTAWTDGSAADPRAAMISQLDWVAPTFFSLGHERQSRCHRRCADAPHPGRCACIVRWCVPVLQNAANAKWDGAGATAIMQSSGPPRRVRQPDRRRARKVGRCRRHGRLREPAEARHCRARSTFVAGISTRGLRPASPRSSRCTMPIDDADWSAKRLAAVADKVVLDGL